MIWDEVIREATVPVLASLVGASAGGAISAWFYWRGSVRQRDAESVQFAADVIQATYDLHPVTEAYSPPWRRDEEERVVDTRGITAFEVRRALYAFAATQPKKYRPSLRAEFLSLVKALKKLPKGRTVPTSSHKNDPGLRLVLDFGAYRDTIVHVFEQVPDIEANKIVDKLARARADFETALENNSQG